MAISVHSIDPPVGGESRGRMKELLGIRYWALGNGIVLE
jgi:hypothetical protein